MTMSEEVKDVNSVALAKIAAMETELATLRRERSAATAPPKPGIDPAHLVRDPIGTLTKYGVPKDHVTKVLVADALGDQASPELRTYATHGPIVAAQGELAAELAALRQRLDASDKERARQTTLESAHKLTADKSKYPHLSTALRADPDLIREEIDRTGVSAVEAIDVVEARLARAAKALGAPPASQETAGTHTGTDAGSGSTSRQTTAHNAGDPPPVNRGYSRGFSDEERNRLRDEIVRKAERGVYDIPGHPYRQTD